MAGERTFSDKFFLFLKGLAMGAANKVPGVSGGIVAFVAGFYEELIYSLQKVNGKAFKLLLNGRFKSFFRYTNAPFLVLIFSGSVFSYFSVSQVLDYFIRNYELYVWSAFFGMIVGSIYYVSKQFNDWRLKNILGILVGISIGVTISFMSPAKENDNLWFVFLCGIIGVTGMTLPGLSGSFILILMGNYVMLLVDSVNMLYKSIIDVFSGNFDFLDDPVRVRYLKIVATFGTGSAVGLVITSQILGYVLKRWHQLVTAIIIGFISGSLGIVWPWKHKVYKVENEQFLLDSKGNKIIENYQRFIPDLADRETWISIVFILLGISILMMIDYYGKNLNSMYKFGLIGKDISYSFSKIYFTKKFAELGLDNHQYENFDLPNIEAFPSLISEDIRGFNVTIPYKVKVMQFLDVIDSEASQIGAVNTIKINRGKLWGFNTDVYGFESSLQPLLKTHHNKALILGSGGASKAVGFVLKKMGLLYQVVSRDPKGKEISYQALTADVLSRHTVIINCTPLGTFPDIKMAPPLAYEYCNESHLFFDLIYNPDRTQFLKLGGLQGATIKNGLEMLELQAEKSWEIWNQ